MKVLYTQHSKQRMNQRLIGHNEIMEVLHKGRYNFIEQYTFKVTFGDIEVVVEEKKKKLTIVSVMYCKRFNNKVKHLMKKNRISKRQAIRELKISA